MQCLRQGHFTLWLMEPQDDEASPGARKLDPYSAERIAAARGESDVSGGASGERERARPAKMSRAKLALALGCGILVLVVVLILATGGPMQLDMFETRDWMVQGPQAIEGRTCVRVYGGDGFIAVCREAESEYSCWHPDKTLPGGRVPTWSRMDRDDGDCGGAVAEVIYWSSL
jgi:hypothetical protein